jgi:hypothetical protein
MLLGTGIRFALYWRLPGHSLHPKEAPMFRLFSILIVGLVLTSLAVAADEIHSGKVLLAKDGKISIQDKDGNSEVFSVAADAKITLDGKAIDLQEIPNGAVAKITVKTVGEKKTAVAIEAKAKE